MSVRPLQAPVAVCSDWDSLFAALQARIPSMQRLTASGTSARAVLAAPVAIARWIAERAPQLAATPGPVRILVVGAEKLDAVDQGRWYRFVPALLDVAVGVDVTLVGDCLDAGARSTLRALALDAPAHLHTGSLADYLDTRAADQHDLVFLFHPGFQKHRGWLSDSSLAAIVAAGVPTVAAAYGQDESEVDRWVAESYGYSTHPEPVLNPFYLDLSDDHSAVHWARALWQFGDQVPQADTEPDQARLAQLDQLSRMVMHSIALGNSPLASHGMPVELKASSGAVRRLVYLFDEYLLDPDTAELLALRVGKLQHVAILPASTIAGYPRMPASDLERAVWAASIKAQHLMPYYAVREDTSAEHALARAMYADLTHKVDALLKG